MNQIRVWSIGEMVLKGKTVVPGEKQTPTPFLCSWFSAISNGRSIITYIIS